MIPRNFCEQEKRPLIALDAQQMTMLRAADVVIRFIEELELQVLNVAGSPLSSWPEGYGLAIGVVGEVIGKFRGWPGPRG